MDCPKCGGPMWDNRGRKKNPKAPDFRCKDKDNCDGVIWPPKGATAAPGAPVANGHAPKWTWGQLSTMYQRSLLIAQKHVTAAKLPATTAEVLAAAATVFIAATRDGVKPVKEKAPAKAPAPPPPEPVLADEEDDDDLPF